MGPAIGVRPNVRKLLAKFHPKVHLIAHSSYKKHVAKIICTLACEDSNCDCSTENCSNVSENKECPSSCAKRPNGCKNQTFRTFYYKEPCFRIGQAEKKGMGLFAKRQINPGELVILYNGEIISKEEYIKRQNIYLKNGQKHFYMFKAGSFFIDPTVRGNSGRFANHSCEPNLQVVRRVMTKRKKGFQAIGYFAIASIPEGTELTVDYNFDYNKLTSQRCFCGTRNCKGWIGRPPPKTPKRRFVPSLVDENLEDEDLEDEKLSESIEQKRNSEIENMNPEKIR